MNFEKKIIKIYNYVAFCFVYVSLWFLKIFLTPLLLILCGRNMNKS